MGILGALFGSNRLKKGKRDQYFIIATAGLSLQTRADVRLTENAGLVFNPIEPAFFDNLESEMRQILGKSGGNKDTTLEVHDDDYGTKWAVLHNKDFEALVATVHLVGEQITEHGFGDRLLAAVFRMDFEGKSTYWIYNIKRGDFYPMVLFGNQQRDKDAEIRMGQLMRQENMPLERSVDQWYALWGIPF